MRVAILFAILIAAPARAELPSTEPVEIDPKPLPGRWTAAGHGCERRDATLPASVSAQRYGVGSLLASQPLIDLALQLAAERYHQIPLKTRTPKAGELARFAVQPACLFGSSDDMRVLVCYYHDASQRRFFEVEYLEPSARSSEAQFFKRANPTQRAAAAQLGFR